MAAKYNKLLKLYGTCHRGINSGSILCENDIKQLCKSKAEEVAAKYNKLFKLYGTSEELTVAVSSVRKTSSSL